MLFQALKTVKCFLCLGKMETIKYNSDFRNPKLGHDGKVEVLSELNSIAVTFKFQLQSGLVASAKSAFTTMKACSKEGREACSSGEK